MSSTFMKRVDILFRTRYIQLGVEFPPWSPMVNKCVYLWSDKKLWKTTSTKWHMWGYLWGSLLIEDKLWPCGSLICPFLNVSSTLSEDPFMQPGGLLLTWPSLKFMTYMTWCLKKGTHPHMLTSHNLTNASLKNKNNQETRTFLPLQLGKMANRSHTWPLNLAQEDKKNT